LYNSDREGDLFMIYVALFGGLLPASIILSAYIVEYRRTYYTKSKKKLSITQKNYHFKPYKQED
jgi:hypothetical protein